LDEAGEYALSDRNDLFGTWVHVFEQDSKEGAVFRPEDADIPLSRRPRERVELHEDGSAVLLMAGADDRYGSQPARWSREDGEIVVRDSRDRVHMRIVQESPGRLVVRMGGR
jgi:hypothetical protein